MASLQIWALRSRVDLVSHWCPERSEQPFPLRTFPSRDCITALGFDVVAESDVHIRMAEYGLDHFVRHTEPVQIRSQSAPSRMPSVPARQTIVTLEFVAFFYVQLVIGKTAIQAAINRR